MDAGPTSTAALPDAFGSQLAASPFREALPYHHQFPQDHRPHGDLMPTEVLHQVTLDPASGHCAGQGQQQGRSLYPRALSAVEFRDRLDYWVAATGKGQGQDKGWGQGRGCKDRASEARGVGGTQSWVPSVGRCGSARHRLARGSDEEAEAEACTASFLPSAGLRHCSSAAPLQRVPSTPSRHTEAQAQSHVPAQGQSNVQSQVFSLPQGVPTRRHQGSQPFTQSRSPAAGDSRRSSGDASSASRDSASYCQSQHASGVPCETALRALFVHSLSVSSDPENYTGGAPGTPLAGDGAPQAPVFNPAHPGVGLVRAPGGYTRQGGDAPARRKELSGKSDSGYYSSFSRPRLAPASSNTTVPGAYPSTYGKPGAYKQAHMGSPSVRSLQSAMLPPVTSLDGTSSLPMAGEPQGGDLRTQSARLGGLRVPGVDPQAHRGASPLERYHSLQDEDVPVHGGQQFRAGRSHLSPSTPSAAATSQEGSVFHWATRARIHAKSDLSRRSSV